MMIDDPLAAMELLEQLQERLPLPARLTAELRANLGKQNASEAVPASCGIIGLHYLGDEGGILCKLDLGAAMTNEAFVSITHLRFDPRQPLSRKIAAYQKHRVKRLQRQPAI